MRMGVFGNKAGVPRRGGAWRGLLLGLVILAGMMALLAPSFRSLIDPAGPPVHGGVVDYSRFGPLDRPVSLAGQWRATWLTGASLPAGSVAAVKVPGRWSGAATAGGPMPDRGVARYRVELRGLSPGFHQLHVPSLYGASRVSIDGRVVSQRGVLGTSPATTRYLVRAHNVPFEVRGGPVEVAIDIASWIHQDNGLEEAPVLGTASAMDSWGALEWSREQLYNISLILVALMGIAVFLFRRQDKAPLFLGLGCLMFLPAAAILGFDNILLIQLPELSFRAMMTIQYLTVTGSVVCFFVATNLLFPAESPRWLLRGALAWIGLLTVRQIWYFARGDLLGASTTQDIVMLSLLGLFVLILVIVARATLRRREGAAIFFLGVSIFIGTFAMGAAVSRGWLGSDNAVGYEFSSLGISMLLYSQVVLMAERWALAVRQAEAINEDLRQLLEVNSAITSDLRLGSLLEKIVGVTSKIIRADRSSLFLKPEKERALVSLVAEGVGEKTISFDAGHGIAGYAYATGEAVNIPDAYADARFNRAIDAETGYRTKSVLTVPITARDGRRLGVMQALNRLDGGAFDTADLERMSAFAAQAAVAIDNARLFGEVVAARNFDESILSSMAAGVIALDASWTITKLNAAAAEVLGAPASLLEGMDARNLINRNNPWLVDEIVAVVESGESKLLLDVDLVTAREQPASVNLSIVPLRRGADADEGEGGGILLLIEDISEEKRLQGTMRRFMSQSVVDQVLGRGDDLMFGTACTASVLFADIRGFTTMAEQLTPRETVETLNGLFAELFEAVAANDGVLDKFIGDAIMAVFGAPLASGRDPANAVEAGLEMLRMTGEISAARAARGEPPVRLGVGIATGEVVAGTIGSPKRMDYTVIGDSVNLASRLQDLTKTYGVELLVDEATAGALDGIAALREIDRIRVKGRERPETIFEVMDAAFAVNGRAALLDAYRAGRAALPERRWADAIRAFEEAVRIDPADRPSQIMLDRARKWATQPPAEGWDGVWRHTAKA